MSRFVEPIYSDPYSFYVPIGFSPEAKVIEGLSRPDIKAITVIGQPLGEARIVTHQRVAITESKAPESMQRLQEIARECSAKSWDGSNEKPISSQTLNYAKLLVNSLPAAAPTPDIEPEPDGNINFEWRRSKDYIFEVSISNDGILFFAGMFGATKRIRGRLEFDDSMPEEINDILLKYF